MSDVVKTALVTGATKGIGRAGALRLGDEGWWVLATGTDRHEGEQLETELQSRSGGRFVPADLRDEDAPAALVDRAVRETGRLDVLVNNAGVHGKAAIPEVSIADYDHMMAVNVRACFLLCQAAIPVMRDGDGGVVINVSSEAGLSAIPGQAPYNMSKATQLMLTKCVAVDHAADGIRAVSVCPGTTHTPLVQRGLAAASDPEALQRRLAESRPAGRLGEPAEVAAAIAFAARDEVAYMTGCEIVIDGGKTAQ